MSASAVEKNVPSVGYDPQWRFARSEDLNDPVWVYALECFGEVERKDGTWQHLIEHSLDGLDSSLWFAEKIKDSLRGMQVWGYCPCKNCRDASVNDSLKGRRHAQWSEVVRRGSHFGFGDPRLH